jgi:hypothetical protein
VFRLVQHLTNTASFQLFFLNTILSFPLPDGLQLLHLLFVYDPLLREGGSVLLGVHPRPLLVLKLLPNVGGPDELCVDFISVNNWWLCLLPDK